MARLVKILLILLVAVVGVGMLASVALFLFFDPNDFRENISAGVKEATGRDLVIEGDLSLSLFPWIAIEIGRTRLGNAEGFGDEPFLSFEAARLSVRVMPLLFERKLAVGTASLDSLTINLQVNANGETNWDDLAGADKSPEEQIADDILHEQPELAGTGPASFDIANISISNASVSYTDAQAGSRASITDLSLKTGRIAAGSAFDLDAKFKFKSTPGDLGGELSISGTILASEGMAQIDITGLNVSGILQGLAAQATDFNFDARAIEVDVAGQSITLGEMDLSLLGISMVANVEPFSYAASPQPTAAITVHEFSLKTLMTTLGAEPPETADENALQRVSFSATAAVGAKAVALTDMRLTLDDTTVTGTLSLPKSADGAILFDLSADSMVLDHYMAPPLDPEVAAADADTANIEIPVDMIRALHASGKVRMERAVLSGIVFENLQLGLQSANGKLRLHPISADIFDGTYTGDVRIDATGKEAAISVNENIVDVQLASLAAAMYGVENVSGTINGSFVLTGRGIDLDAIRRDLDGTVAFVLADGALLGTDVWHELRQARAMLKGEPAPEPRLPVRTEFSTVSASGKVTDGVLRNDDFLAELPFLRLTGKGSVNFVEASLNYAMEARVLDSPEFAGQVSAAELKDFTSAVIPLKVSGSLASPSIKPDIDALIKQQIQKKFEKEKKKFFNRLLGMPLPADDAKPASEAEDTDNPEDNEAEEEPDAEDLIKDALKNLFGG